ncbi:MAG: hypothetical protein QOF48_977 [Verrucomicrobiota bacterium]|jgi:hypothetical protein
MKHFTMCLMLLALVTTTTGCRSLLPREVKRPRTQWQSFDEAQAAFDKIVPHKTTVTDLKALGFDPISTPNVKILTYLDLIDRFIPNNSITLKDLQPDVRDCIESKDCCHAYELNLEFSDNKRYGNVVLDVFGFRKYSHITGWTFKALIIVKDDTVAYKLRSGEPNTNRYERKVKPLGPLQELDGMIMKVPGMM